MMTRVFRPACAAAVLILFAWMPVGMAGQAPTAASPASKPPPATVTPQSYPPEQVQTGQTRFVAQCGFCHGRDAGGGEAGPDLIRSGLVAQDVRGDKLAPVIRQGRPDKGMPGSNLSDTDIAAIVAFIHDTKTKAEAEGGGRRTVDVADLQTGDIEAGRRYFNGTGGCVKCHAPASGEFAKIGARYEGLALLHRLLYPGSGGRASGPAPARPTVTVTTRDGQIVTGRLVQLDEFVVVLTDANGWSRSWPARQVRISVDDPLQAHVNQLGKYTDKDMHDVFAYLQSLK